MATYTALDIITDSCIEIGIIAPGEDLPGEQAQWAFRQLNDLLDTWSALQAFAYSIQIPVYTLIANHQPHTIGPDTADFAQDQRPVRLLSAALLLNDSGTEIVDLPINIRDKDWWAKNQVKNIQTNVPTDVYYDPTWPNGSLYFWPVPNQQRQVRFEFWVLINQLVTITDEIGGVAGPGTLPPAYRAAIKYTLAEMLCPGAEKTLDPVLEGKARKARVAVFGNNAKSPRMSTQDAGMPKTGLPRPEFNWKSGQPM